MNEPDSTLTFRCWRCATCWPYYQPFATCPNPECDNEATTALRLEDGQGILTIDEANERLRDWGIKVVPTPRKHRGRNPTKNEINSLYEALDEWAHKRPSWMG